MKKKTALSSFVAAILFYIIVYFFCDQYGNHYVSTAPRRIDLYTHITAITNLTQEEQDEVLNTIRIVIPQNENNITVRYFSKTKYNLYYIELDGITDREAFYAANNINTRPQELHLPDYWDKTYRCYLTSRIQKTK